ncbi:MAG: hypothetical protein COS89_05960 [Deltaproteobacteria bacterium CG07_land_8_20_14_0_80_38_7]|nr:MAG: hypothetical protein COS89_05960 [Deltaproteobacteria bacterium CG07_land_8_20_14_0_80_38_7]
MKENLPAIFAALDDEVRIVRSKMQIDERIHIRPSVIIRGKIGKKSCLLVRTGVGKEAMMNAVSYVLENFKTQVCLNVGYAGGTVPDLHPGDLLIGAPVIDRNTKVSFFPQNDLIAQILKICKQIDIKVVKGGLVTVDDVIKTPHEKAFIGTEHAAMAVDMESSAFMEECGKREILAIVVRSILDSLDVFLPDISDAIDEQGELSIGQFAGHIISKPKDILSLPRIEYCAMKAREAISTLIEGWIKIL